MKTMKKALALLMVLAMVMAVLPAAFADNQDVSGHTFEAYQIFSATSISDGQLGNIDWGNGISDEGKTALLNKYKPADFEGEFTLEDLIPILAGLTSSQANELAAFLNNNKSGSSLEVESGTTKLPIGYYLIVDVENLTDEDEVNNISVLLVSDNNAVVTVQSKVEKPKFEKKVKDINDSTQTTMTDWQDSADHDLGDTIPFKLEATLGSVAGYDSYYLEFADNASKGLKIETNSFKVYYRQNGAESSTDITSAFTVSSLTDITADGEYKGGHSFTVTCDDILAIDGITPGSGDKIWVEYNATLTSDALLGSAGNPNEAKLIYSNNPNNNGKGETAEDKVIVFTYKVVVNKVDEDENPLAGAAFKLEKEVNGVFTQVGEILGGTTETTFTWTHLDDGKYMITETATPAGYNSIDPMVFTITADHDVEADNPALKTLSGNSTTGLVLTFDKAAGSATTTIENQSGSTLPSTGGMGTTLFYVMGSILVVGAGILLVSKKRMGAAE